TSSCRPISAEAAGPWTRPGDETASGCNPGSRPRRGDGGRAGSGLAGGGPVVGALGAVLGRGVRHAVVPPGGDPQGRRGRRGLRLGLPQPAAGGLGAGDLVLARPDRRHAVPLLHTAGGATDRSRLEVTGGVDELPAGR